MVVKSGITDDARIRRVAAAVAEIGHDVTVIGDRPGPDDPISGVDVQFARKPRPRGPAGFTDPFRRAARWLLLPTHRRRDDRAFAAAVAELPNMSSPDIVHAHDLSGLRAAKPWVDAGATLIYDAHECCTRQRLVGRPTPLGHLIDRRAERRLGSQADRVITVSSPLGNWLEKTYGWTHVDIVRNTFPMTRTPKVNLQPRGLLYAGRVDKERDLETVIAGAAGYDGLDVVVRGQGDSAMCRVLEAHGVVVQPAMPVDQLTEDYQRYGIGVVSLSGDSFNHKVALPNKLFHAVQAGVPVVAADLPAIRDVVDRHRIGECYTPGDADSFAAALGRVLEHYDQMCIAVAHSRDLLSWSHDKQVLTDIYQGLPA